MRAAIFPFASTAVAEVAPRLKASIENEPEPANNSRTERPSISPIILNMACLTFDDVYRAMSLERTVMGVPLSLPPVIRIVDMA